MAKAKKKSAVKKPEAEAKVYRVSDGYSVTSKRGILPAGEPVQPSDFIEGQKTIDDLKKIGAVESK